MKIGKINKKALVGVLTSACILTGCSSAKTYVSEEVKVEDTKVYEPQEHSVIKEYDGRSEGLELEQHDGYEIFEIGKYYIKGLGRRNYVVYLNNETVEVKLDKNGEPNEFGTPIEKEKKYSK